ncbi:MAG: ShlB/FhaC/HecB family hemolysin secretion/activation protein [Allosphingosinicella sp.]
MSSRAGLAALLAWVALCAPAQVAGEPAARKSAQAMVVLPPKSRWQTVFPVMIRPPRRGGAKPADPCKPSGRRFLNVDWLRDCLANGTGADVTGKETDFAIDRERLPQLYANIEKANTAFYENGYVNSGILLKEEGEKLHIEPVEGRLVDGEDRACAFDRPLDASAIAREARGRGLPSGSYPYVRRRLMQGCNPKAPFNVYLLERDFRRLADDNDPWIDNVNMGLRPRPGTEGRGKAELVSPRDASDGLGGQAIALPSDRTADDAPTPPPFVVTKPWIEAEIGVANDRPPSTGSIRAFAGLTLRGPAGFLFSADAGATEGALDGAGSLLVALRPRWSARLAADFNEAEIVDPALRPLDIRSRGWGFEGSLYYGAIRCPLTPLFGEPLLREARRATAGDGIESCRLAARRIGDAPVGWASARDLTLGLTLSHRSSQSFLLGEPFSFAPGSVDGRSHVTAIRASADWLQRGRTTPGGERGWTLGGRLRLSFGLDGSATDIAGLATPSRHFVLISGQIGYSRQLRWKELLLTARLSGQWSNQLLYTSERLPVGGPNSVRGYPQAALLVDRGLVGSVELSRYFSLGRERAPFGQGGGFDPQRFRVTLFADAAWASNLNPATRRDDELGAIGAGLAWIPSQAITVRVDYGLRLGRDLAGPGPALVNDGLHFGVTLRPLRL